MGRTLRMNVHLDKDKVTCKIHKNIGLDSLHVVFKYNNKKILSVIIDSLEYEKNGIMHNTLSTPYTSIPIGHKRLNIDLGLNSANCDLTLDSNGFVILGQCKYLKVPAGYVAMYDPIFCLNNKLQDSIRNLILESINLCAKPKYKKLAMSYLKNDIDKNAKDISWLKDVVKNSPILKLHKNNKLVKERYALFNKAMLKLEKLMERS